ncbi:MAG: putative DNA-binding protein, partial [Alkaliphilus sp.]|nr:putative DNA-binding protein [Alkaliphilus sp.]
MLEKTVEISVLYDFYNQLLTEKQKNIVDLYYNQDLSLGEIADEFDISRQAVYDMLKRTERLLYQYEEKLNFIRHTDIKNEKILDILNSVIN